MLETSVDEVKSTWLKLQYFSVEDEIELVSGRVDEWRKESEAAIIGTIRITMRRKIPAAIKLQ